VTNGNRTDRSEKPILDIEFTPIRKMASYQQVAEQIKRSIVSGKLQVGEQLPSERKLQAQFGISRVVVREAMRALSAEGLIETQAGRGHFVSYQPSRTISDTLALSLLLEPDAVSQLVELLSILEEACARLATTRCTEKDLTAIESALNQMIETSCDSETFREASHQFHRALAEGTHSRFLALVTQSVLALFFVGSDELEPLFPDVRRIDPRHWVPQHQQILAALRARDSNAALAAMSRHFKRLDQALAPYSPPPPFDTGKG
jgi:DNA-binding FadR family transcriptional regulator